MTKTTFVISHDGKRAWQWDNPSNVVYFKDVLVTVDDWKERMKSVGINIVDDREQPHGNVWN